MLLYAALVSEPIQAAYKFRQQNCHRILWTMFLVEEQMPFSPDFIDTDFCMSKHLMPLRYCLQLLIQKKVKKKLLIWSM